MIRRKMHTLTLSGINYMEVNRFTKPYFEMALKKSKIVEIREENYEPDDKFFYPVEKQIELFCERTGLTREDAISDFCERGVVFQRSMSYAKKLFNK